MIRTVRFPITIIHNKLLLYNHTIIYSLRFAARVGVPASEEPGVGLGEGVLAGETWVAGPGDGASKSYLKRGDRVGVEGPVRNEVIANLDHRENGIGMLYLDQKLLRGEGW
jgi:hypothetical protein